MDEYRMTQLTCLLGKTTYKLQPGIRVRIA